MTELLAPAGDFERLYFAFLYGADAVYFGGQNFGLRANAKNFNLEEIKNSYQATSVDLTTKHEVTEIIKQVNLPVLFQKDHTYQIQITSEQDGYRLLEALQQANVPITKFEIKKPSLNDIFIEKVGK